VAATSGSKSLSCRYNIAARNECASSERELTFNAFSISAEASSMRLASSAIPALSAIASTRFGLIESALLRAAVVSSSPSSRLLRATARKTRALFGLILNASLRKSAASP
jgi:hypothetical protein